ncbi:MAG: hypothetical protein QXV62_04630 [Nitrososphaerota archaeon]
MKGRVGYGREYKELLTPLQQLQQSSPDRKVIERDWLVGETQTEMAEMDAVYALDLAATPSQAIKIGR